MAETVRTLGEVAWDVLQRMVRDLLARKAGGHLVEARLEELELRLPLALRGPAADPAVFSVELAASLDRLLDDAIRQAAAFRPGHAFCHRCGGADCEHCSPPSSRHIFTGYTPTGTPLWQDFAQFCLERKHPEVDRLYDESPALLTVVQAGRELHGRLLEAFQAPHYEAKGQLVAGFFPFMPRGGSRRELLAVTFQVVATRGANGPSRLGLNILGTAPEGEGIGALWDRYEDVPWRRAARWAQSALASLGGGARRTRRALPESERNRRVEGILGGMARRLERELRSRARRTRHAELRHRSGERPTRHAIDDIRAARSGAFLVDDRNGSVVVLGDRGRTHFFTPEGRLVSSVRYSREAIDRKQKLGLWREASEDELLTLRERLLGSVEGVGNDN